MAFSNSQSICCCVDFTILGHAIEGNRPSLMTSLTQTAFQAPLFTLEHSMPFIFEN